MDMPVRGAGRQIESVLSNWPGVAAQPHRFGGREFVLGTREIGHVHGDGLVDIPFPLRVRDEVIAAGLAERHHILPDSGWVSLWLREPADLDKALALFRRSYELALAQKARREAAGAG